MKKKKLLILTDNYLPRRDGVVTFLREILPRLKLLFDITLVCPDHVDLKESKNITLVRIPTSKKYVADFYLPKFRPFKIAKAIIKTDIVFSQTIGPIGATGLFIAQRLGKKTVSFIHSLEWELVNKAIKNNFWKNHSPNLARWLARFLYRRCSSLIVPSDNIGDQLTWERIMTPREIIHLGTDTEKFKPLDALERKKRREELGFKTTDIIIGYHGRISREKDVETLLRAFVKLRNKHKNLKLFIIGSGVPSIEKKLKDQPETVYMKAIDNVEYYLPLMDIYCLPSLTETTSLSVLEAMSCELPVISTQVGFVKDYIKPEVTGLFFKKKDSFALAKVIEELMVKEKLMHELGLNARAMVKEKFNWDITAKKLTNFFKNMDDKIKYKENDAPEL